jgi:hypothetical protein
LAPAFPLDARVRSVTVDGRDTPFEIDRRGDVQRPMVALPLPAATSTVRVAFNVDEGTEVYAPIETPARGAVTEGLRILRSRADGGTLRLTVEGVGGRTYVVGVRSPRSVGEAPGVKIKTAADANANGANGAASGGAGRPGAAGRTELSVAFDGPPGQYVRRTIDLPLR